MAYGATSNVTHPNLEMSQEAHLRFIFFISSPKLAKEKLSASVQ